MRTKPDSSAIRLPMEVEYQPAWLTWVASTTTCLRALGIECDRADVAGFSGYAFHVGVHEEVCPSGPTALDWSRLSRGVHSLGRATIEFRSPSCEASDSAREDSCRAAFELVRSELLVGRPCVLWGTYLPEFGVVVGIEGDAYRVKSFKEILQQEQPAIPYSETEPPGGIYALGFPARAEYGELRRDLEAILEALRQWRRPPYGQVPIRGRRVRPLDRGTYGRTGLIVSAAATTRPAMPKVDVSLSSSSSECPPAVRSPPTCCDRPPSRIETQPTPWTVSARSFHSVMMTKAVSQPRPRLGRPRGFWQRPEMPKPGL